MKDTITENTGIALRPAGWVAVIGAVVIGAGAWFTLRAEVSTQSEQLRTQNADIWTELREQRKVQQQTRELVIEVNAAVKELRAQRRSSAP